jgi:hypothetical protein
MVGDGGEDGDGRLEGPLLRRRGFSGAKVSRTSAMRAKYSLVPFTTGSPRRAQDRQWMFRTG